jgi:hypothetical protein
MLWPHFQHSGLALSFNLREWNLVQEEGLEGMARCALIFASHSGMSMDRAELLASGLDISFAQCHLRCSEKSMCQFPCKAVLEGIAKAFSLDLKCSFHRGEGEEDRCRLRLGEGEPRRSLDLAVSTELPEGWREKISSGYLIAGWCNLANGLYDSVGGERFLELMAAPMRRLAGEYSVQLKKQTSDPAEALQLALRGVGITSKSYDLGRSHKVTLIDQCWLKAEHHEFCVAMDHFLTEALRPFDLETCHLCMSTKGDAACLLRSEILSHSGSAIERQDLSYELKKRLVRGEISLSDFEEISRRL